MNFKRIDKICSGTYGIVYSMKVGDEIIAFKRNLTANSDPFTSYIREVSILNMLNHPLIIGLKFVSVGIPGGAQMSPVARGNNGIRSGGEDPIHFGFELGLCDLHGLIYGPDGSSGYNERHFKHYKTIILSMLIALNYIHSIEMCHRDIKPSNIIIFVDGDVMYSKIADFGFAKILINCELETELVSSAWYRAPEMDAKCSYDLRIDIWALGCIIFEMFRFSQMMSHISLESCDTHYEVLSIMMYKTNIAEFNKYIREKGGVVIDQSRIHLNHFLNIDMRKKLSVKDNDILMINEYLGNYDNVLLLIDGMLCVNPSQRLTLNQCFNSPLWNNNDRAYIQQAITSIPLPNLSDPTIDYIHCIERVEMSRIISNRSNFYSRQINAHPWRELFQAVSIFDRYIKYLHKNNVRDGGRYIAAANISVVTNVCLYMSYCYFNPWIYSIQSFSTFALVKDINIIANASAIHENILINALEYNVYRHTLYETVCPMSKVNKGKLLILYLYNRSILYHSIQEIKDKFLTIWGSVPVSEASNVANIPIL